MALDPTTRSLIVSKFPEYAATVDSLSALPGFDSVMQKGYEMATAYGGPGMNIGNVRGTGLGILKGGLKGASTDPVTFVKGVMRDAVYSGDTNLLKTQIQYLQTNKVPLEDIKSLYTSYATQKAQGEAEIAALRAAQSKGGGLFGGFFDSLASIDPSRAISQAATDLFNPIAQAATDLFQPVEKAVSTAVSDVSKALSTDDAKKAMAIAAAYYLPGVGAQLGQTLVTQGLITGAAVPYAAAIGTALASTGASVAQGVPFDTALTNATVNAVTSTGSQSVAGYISKLGASPEVANAITSVGASGLATAAKGGSAADIERNMTGALAGSAVTGLTGDKISGAVVGGQVTGGTTGALMGAAGAAGAEAARPAETTSAPQSGINLAAADTGTATDAGTGFRVDVPGAPIYAEQSAAANVKAPFGYSVMPMSMADNKPEGSYYDTTQNAWLVPNADVQKLSSVLSEGDTGGQIPTSPTAAGTANVSVSGPVAGEGLVIASDKATTGGGSSVSPSDQKVLDLIKPTPTPGQAAVAGPVFTPATFTPATAPGRGVETDEERIARLDAQTARVIAQEADYTARSRPGTGTGGGNVVVGPGDGGGGPGGNVTIDAGGGGGNATSNVSGNVVVDEPPVEEVAPPAEEEKPPAEEEKPPEEDEKPPEEEDKPPGEKEEPYKPDLFIYSGRTPKPRPRTNLGTTLQAPFAPSTTLGQALTGYRGAGEIEGKKTGKPRRDVWNEESLRLKDALGL